MLEQLKISMYVILWYRIRNCWYWKIIFNQDDSLPRLDDPLSSDVIAIYQQFHKIYHLGIVQHQSDEQRKFRDLLLHLHDGESTENDESTEDG
ncbi:unnamed protein product [Rhizophagus irregularis]|nr:unnamed protein product [Rhizophagus irregularis]